AANAAADAANASASAAADAAVWGALGEDGEHLAKIGWSTESLARTPLWLGDEPESFRQASKRFLSTLRRQGDNWDVWVRWYGRVVAGKNTFDLSQSRAESFDAALATQPGEWWENSPGQVNAAIKELANNHGKSFDIEPVSPMVPPPAPKPKVREKPKANRKPKPKPTPQAVELLESKTAFLSDVPDPDVDYLNRSHLAFLLAGRLNQIWDEVNGETADDLDIQEDGDPSEEEPSSGFVVHIDAPWG
ncbi:MAG: hypothetical protein GY953_49450, partial [bacterium]|nr:hypothetical protein [bacterium]